MSILGSIKPILSCLYCQSENIIKHGISITGGQRFKCKKCEESFSIGGKRGTYTIEFKNTITNLYCHTKKTAQEIIKQFGISSATLIKRAKSHKQQCKICQHTSKK